MPGHGRTLAAMLLASVFTAMAGTASGSCLDGRHPSPEQEFADSAIVATGTARVARIVVDRDDPQGYIATVYEIRVREIFRGRIPRRLYVESENTSSRFPMEEGTTYLMFLQHDDHRAAYFIDNCGNSAPVGAARALLPRLRKMSATTGTMPSK